MPRCTSTASVCHICPSIWGMPCVLLVGPGGGCATVEPCPQLLPPQHGCPWRSMLARHAMPPRWCGFRTDGVFKSSTPLPDAMPGLKMCGDSGVSVYATMPARIITGHRCSTVR